jgi:hypothetical protein
LTLSATNEQRTNLNEKLSTNVDISVDSSASLSQLNSMLNELESEQKLFDRHELKQQIETKMNEQIKNKIKFQKSKTARIQHVRQQLDKLDDSIGFVEPPPESEITPTLDDKLTSKVVVNK